MIWDNWNPLRWRSWRWQLRRRRRRCWQQTSYMFEGCARVNVRIPTNFINECFSSTQNWTPMQEQQNQYQIFELFKFNRQLFKVINCSLPWRWVSGDGVNLFNSFRLEIIFKFIMPYWQSFFFANFISLLSWLLLGLSLFAKIIVMWIISILNWQSSRSHANVPSEWLSFKKDGKTKKWKKKKKMSQNSKY